MLLSQIIGNIIVVQVRCYFSIYSPVAALQIHPDPANTWTAFTFHVPGNRATLHLRIRDTQGRIAHSMQATGEEGQVLWDTRNVAPGVYTVELLREGKLERTERLVIQP